MSLLISFRGPRRRQILVPAKGGRRSVAEGSMSLPPPGELRSSFLSPLRLLFSFRFCLRLSMSFFISSRSLLGSISSSQTDPPTLTNVDFLYGILTCLKNQRFRSHDGFENVWGLSRAPFGGAWASPGGLLGAPSGPGSTKECLQSRAGTFLGLVCSRLAAEDGPGNVVGRL